MKNQLSRRDFIKKTGISLLAIPLLGSLGSVSSLMAAPSSRTKLKTKNQVRGFEYPKHPGKLNLNVLDFGVVGDGVTLNTKALQQAIDRCFVLGGGEVFVPAGDYLTGAIQLRSGVLLRLHPEAILRGTPNFEDYPVTQVRWEGKWIQGYTALIFAVDASYTGITGEGKIIGHPALGGRPNKDNPLRHPALIEPINCKNLLFSDFSTSYKSMWCIHPTYCENIHFKDLTIRSTGGNGDGIDVDSCKHVLIEGCDIETGDDCIAIKSGRGMEANVLMRTTEDVYIRNCRLSDSIFACIGIGSETSGGIRGVRIEHCRFEKTRTHAIYIKSRPGRGAFIEDISAEDLDVSDMQGGFLRFNLMGSGLQDQVPVPGFEGIPSVKNFSFKNVRVKDVKDLVEGTSIHPDKPLEGLVLEQISGEANWGIRLANVRNAVLRDINVNIREGDVLSIHNVQGKGLDNAKSMAFPHKIEAAIVEPDPPYVLK
jgi:polygalacturonase